ncbi:MAG TPA: hypothetical protein VNA14_03700, partial [Mycobacteriales bacterium]|nr:hypothetical protein [Mycobacteriales bacterium]
RPGIVAGPHDPTGRFTAWVRRMMRPGPVLSSRPDGPVQVVHARDLADVMLRATEQRLAETFNAVGPTSDGVTMSEVIATCATAAGVDEPEVVWVDESFVVDNEIPLPLFLPRSAGRDGMFHASCRRAESLGLVNRPLLDTAHDTLAWITSADDPGVHVELLTEEREAAALAAWAAR